MSSNYKKLGDYIQPINERNKELKVETLLGVSVQKVFIPSIANTVGTNFKNYKIVCKNQFVYIADTSRRGDKIGLAMLEEYEEALVSQAYTVFEIIDENKLHPEYLMMWFRRPEFDRYARFKSHGSVREVFDWEEMCEVELPIPSIEKQQEIVDEYNTVTNRIKLNEQLNLKLEETAQALYKHWFVDFEFPNEEGKPYKSSGGEMVYNEELDKEIPVGWSVDRLDILLNFKNGKKKPSSKGKYPVYGGNGIIDFVNDSNFENCIIVGRVGAYCGSLYLERKKCWVSDNAIMGKSLSNELYYCFYLLKYLNLADKREGTGQPLITQGTLNELKIKIPEKNIRIDFNIKTEKIISNIQSNNEQSQKLKELQSLLLAKMTKVEVEKELV
ncbi:restriction endonuclease subunit S [Tenacibaculum singaporense]|uniref:Restriction endonuclease subunit S n=1 Tax=Tenacibaculum singaporense TaxID=2358479 RepID=A0A3Q8RTW5_9FLAO|nr:restriction endonuclease subunit S [Tenacibaculum singaporense]AZJ36615.1 restriction endonuclease subunit S [Tenacibaculum singaporense]